MELAQLQQLETVARTGTMSAAAHELSISQSALSRSIQRLERDLGTSLFTRGKNSATLNDAGLAAVEHARAVLREAQLLRDAVDEAQKRSRVLRVGTCAPAPLWKFTREVVERFPGSVLSSEMMATHRFYLLSRADTSPQVRRIAQAFTAGID